MADNAQTTPAAAAADAGKGSASGSPDAHLAPILNELKGIQSLLGRFGNDIGNLKKAVSQPQRPSAQPGFDFAPSGEEVDPRDRELAQIKAEQEDARKERELDRFMRLSGIEAADWTEIMSRLQSDEARYHRFNQKGKMDYFASYDAVWKDLQLERFQTAQQAAEEQRAKQDIQRDLTKRQAGVSGVGATGLEGDEAIDISRMSSTEYLEKVLKPAGMVDPKDPPTTRPYVG